VAVGPNGDLYLADTENCVVRKISGGTISTVAGEAPNPSTHCGYDGDNQNAAGAQLNKPTGIALDQKGNLYIADRENHRVRRVDAQTQQITTIVNTSGAPGSSGDNGPAANAQLRRPHDVYFLLPSEDLLIADAGNNKVRRIDFPAGTITTFAGTGTAAYSGDGGAAISATLNDPEAIAAADYRVAIADTGNNVIRVVNSITGVIATGAGGTTTTLSLDSPKGVTVATDGAIVISNTDAATIVTAGINLGGDRSTNFVPSHGCSYLPGISSIDWALPALLLGAIVVRKRLGTLFVLLRSAAREARAGTAHRLRFGTLTTP